MQQLIIWSFQLSTSSVPGMITSSNFWIDKLIIVHEQLGYKEHETIETSKTDIAFGFFVFMVFSTAFFMCTRSLNGFTRVLYQWIFTPNHCDN